MYLVFKTKYHIIEEIYKCHYNGAVRTWWGNFFQHINHGLCLCTVITTTRATPLRKSDFTKEKLTEHHATCVTKNTEGVPPYIVF